MILAEMTLDKERLEYEIDCINKRGNPTPTAGFLNAALKSCIVTVTVLAIFC